MRLTGAWEVGVEIQPALHLRSRGRVFGIPSQQAENVVATTMPGLDHQAQIGWQSPIIGCSGSFVVFVGWEHVIAQFAGSLFNLAFVVRIGVVFVFLGHGFHFVDGVKGADKGSVRHAIERVAGGTDFAVDLETAAKTAGCE